MYANNKDNALNLNTIDKKDKIMEVLKQITKYRNEAENLEDKLKSQIKLSEKVELEKLTLVKELELSSNQNKELRKKVISLKNKSEGFEDELNNLR